MPIIRANSGVVTQINIFTVPEDKQEPLIELLAEAAEFARSTPGWISASLHRSLDGTRVVNYAQCENLQASQFVIERLRQEGFLERNKLLGAASPGLYEVVFALDR
ncbi:antibiotic biosynthesis monooxygenase [Rhizobium jaguaris]|uniref:Antibiotic biosynthesis monooxygenase n=1 Tax=Rhizobium jaguaris TaxID=1312183 RepID=A0A387FSV1_9HYPH|nr:antibiotic biosynthesis monooxygenase family protein [Rhizobium jaguaris]AYG60525.1 antibiotic biosynthesis monooxygenase [Rhizobium jaguaris]